MSTNLNVDIKNTNTELDSNYYNVENHNWDVIRNIIKNKGVDILSDAAFLDWLDENGIKHREEVQSFNDLPSNDSLNTVRGVADSNKIYIKKENGWVPFQTIDISKINEVERMAINRIEELAITPMKFGAIGDGIADDTIALQQAVNYANENNLLLDLIDKKYRITEMVNLTCGLDGKRATIIADNIQGSPAVLVGSRDTGTFVSAKNILLPNVTNKSKDWTTSIGVEISNTAHCTVITGVVKAFNVGVLYTAYGQGNAYNTFGVAFADDNKVNIKLDPKANGWVNENVFNIQRASQRGENGINAPGTKHIHITHTGTHQPNNNVFMKPSIEGNVAEYAIDIEGGAYNMFISPRFEGANKKVRFGIEGSNKFAQSNVIFYGYGSGGIGYEQSSTSRWNTVYGLNEIKTTGSLNMSNPLGGDSAVINVFGSDKSPITAKMNEYLVKINQQGVGVKNAGDIGDNIKMTPAGLLEFGNGVTNPKRRLRAYGPDLILEGGSLMVEKGTWNEPHLKLGSYHIWVDGTGNLRLKSSAPTSAEDGKKLLTE